MSIEDVYKFYQCNWSEAARKLGLSQKTHINWRKIGYIPMATQLRIQNLTDGKLKAGMLDR